MKPLNKLRSPVSAHLRQFLTIGKNYWKLRRPSAPLKLHLGCGQKRLPGFINIDFNYCLAVDYVCDISKLPCPDGSVARIETYHVIEHIPKPAVLQVLKEWKRVLQPEGVLVIECPDLQAAMMGYLRGDDKLLESVFGLHRFPGDAHCWGYTARSLSAVLEAAGFAGISVMPAQDYHAAKEPCIRVEARKVVDQAGNFSQSQKHANSGGSNLGAHLLH